MCYHRSDQTYVIFLVVRGTDEDLSSLLRPCQQQSGHGAIYILCTKEVQRDPARILQEVRALQQAF